MLWYFNLPRYSSSHLCSEMAANDTCYWPIGTPAMGFEPCNSTANGAVSACCDLTRSVCTTSSICVGIYGNYYRGACTDRSWLSPSCGSQCVDGLHVPSFLTDPDSFPVHPESLNNILRVRLESLIPIHHIAVTIPGQRAATTPASR